MKFKWEKGENGDITVTPEMKMNPKKLMAIIGAIVLLSVGIVWKVNDNKKKAIKDIKAKITAIQENKESSVRDSLYKRGMYLYQINWDIEQFDQDISNTLDEAVNDRRLGELYTQEEVEHIEAELQKIHQSRKIHPSFNCWITDWTTVGYFADHVLARFVGYREGGKLGPYESEYAKNRHDLPCTISFPYEDPVIILTQAGKIVLTNADATAKALDDKAESNFVNAAINLHVAQEKKKIEQDIREYFDRQAEPKIKNLLEELGKMDYKAALDMQRKILGNNH